MSINEYFGKNSNDINKRWVVLMIGLIITIALAIIFFIVISEIKINVLVLKDGKREEIVLTTLALYGLLKYRMELPFLKLFKNKNFVDSFNLNSDIELGKKEVIKDNQQENFNFNEIKIIYKETQAFYRKYYPSIQYIHNRVTIEQIAWATEVGVEDAAVTAIATGVFWMIKSNLVALIYNSFTTDNIQLNVTPYYGGEKFSTTLDCIITLKLGHIIIAGFKIILSKIKGW